MKRVLYLGLNPPLSTTEIQFYHYPIIKVCPKPFDDASIQKCLAALACSSHILFTSQSAVALFFDYLGQTSFTIKNHLVFSVGAKTTAAILKKGYNVHHTADNESQEGIIMLLDSLPCLLGAFVWPRSAQARPLLRNYFCRRGLSLHDFIFYDVKTNTLPLISLSDFDEIFFTSPSTVDAFLELYGCLPKQIALKAIGLVTKAHLLSKP